MSRTVLTSLAACVLAASAATAQQNPNFPGQTVNPNSNSISFPGGQGFVQDQTLDPNGFSNGLPVNWGSNRGGRAASECDDFNRADGPMGNGWIDQVGTQEILSNRGVGTNFQGNAWMLHPTASAAYDQSAVEFDLYAAPSGGTLSYVAAVTGVGSDQLFTKLQHQGGTLFNYAGFYHGFNGGGYSGYGGFVAITPVTGGHVWMYTSNAGDTMNIDIDEDYNGTVDYHYESSGITTSGLSGLLGTGAGLGTYNDGHYDNWDLNGGCGGGGSFTLAASNVIAGSTATLTTTNGTSSGQVGIAYSLIGAGPSSVGAGSCGNITVDLSAPIRVLGTFTSDVSGTMSTTFGVPAGTTGVAVWLQALDFGTCTLSNSVPEIIG